MKVQPQPFKEIRHLQTDGVDITYDVIVEGDADSRIMIGSDGLVWIGQSEDFDNAHEVIQLAKTVDVKGVT